VTTWNISLKKGKHSKALSLIHSNGFFLCVCELLLHHNVQYPMLLEYPMFYCLCDITNVYFG